MSGDNFAVLLVLKYDRPRSFLLHQLLSSSSKYPADCYTMSTSIDTYPEMRDPEHHKKKKNVVESDDVQNWGEGERPEERRSEQAGAGRINRGSKHRSTAAAQRAAGTRDRGSVVGQI